MTSIVIWHNQEDGLRGLWAVSDSRVTSADNILTDNYPKLSVIHALAYERGDLCRSRPRHVLTTAFACAGSTLIGSTVREMLSALLSTLSELDYYDAPDMPFEDKIPTLEEVAHLAATLASRYILSLGMHYPASARIEIAVFGYCARSDALRVFKISNRPEAPATVTVVAVPVNDHDFLILGDRKSDVAEAIAENRAHSEKRSLDWHRAPILALLNLVEDVGFGTIGGSVQLCATGRFGVRLLPLFDSERMQDLLAGFNLFEIFPKIGGFTCGHSLGLVHPGTGGWPSPRR